MSDDMAQVKPKQEYGGLLGHLYRRYIRNRVKKEIHRQRLKIIYDVWWYYPLLSFRGLRWRERISLLWKLIRIDWFVLHASKPAEIVPVMIDLMSRRARSNEIFVEASCWNGGSTQQLHRLERLPKRVEMIRTDLEPSVNRGRFVSYSVPWTSIDDISAASLSLIFSQAVLQYVDALEDTYRAMAQWLRPGGYASHIIDLSAHELSPFWNEHWAYSDWEWRIARGRREIFLNREPLNTHLACAKKFDLEILLLKKDEGNAGLDLADLSPRFRALDSEDLRTRGAMLILRKHSSDGQRN